MISTINRQVFDFNCASEIMAQRVQNEIAYYVVPKLNSIIEELIKQKTDEDEYIKIDRLEVDFGDIYISEFSSEKKLSCVADKLNDILKVVRNNNAVQEIDRIEKNQFEIVQSFLLYGDVPWWADKVGIINFDKILQHSIEVNLKEVQAFFNLHKNNKIVAQRLDRVFKTSIQTVLNSVSVKEENYDSLDIYQIEKNQFEIVQSFLLYGDIPWWADKTGSINFDKILQDSIEVNLKEVQAFFNLHKNNKIVAQRLETVFNTSIQTVLKTLNAVHDNNEHIFIPVQQLVDFSSFSEKKQSLINQILEETGEITINDFISNLQNPAAIFTEAMFSELLHTLQVILSANKKLWYSQSIIVKTALLKLLLHVNRKSAERGLLELLKESDAMLDMLLNLIASPAIANTQSEHNVRLSDNLEIILSKHIAALAGEDRHAQSVLTKIYQQLKLRDSAEDDILMIVQEEADPSVSINQDDKGSFNGAFEGVQENGELVELISGHPNFFTYRLLTIIQRLGDKMFYPYQIKQQKNVPETVGNSKFSEIINSLSLSDMQILHELVDKNKYKKSEEKEVIRKILQQLPAKVLQIAWFLLSISQKEMQDFLDQNHITVVGEEYFTDHVIREKTNDLSNNDKINGEISISEMEKNNVELSNKDKLDVGADLIATLLHNAEGERKVLIENAGLCLLSPYLPSLWKNLAYTENNSFKNHLDACKAVALIEYMATGLIDQPEYRLQFNKLLCGFSVHDLPAENINPTENETAEADSLLEAVISNWKAIKSTSINGFRGSFLQRKGILTEKENHWLLQIERKDYDILLNSLPWGYSTIKFPWMNKHIQVEW